MAVYLFTYHAYRSWGPDRQRGYVRRGEGILPTDRDMAEQYDRNASEPAVQFNASVQRACIEAILEAREHQTFTCRFVATDATHIHVLVDWEGDRAWSVARNAIKSSLTRRLNKAFEKRTWFSEGASRKRVKDRAHFDYLVTDYLHNHVGWKWSLQRDLYL